MIVVCDECGEEVDTDLDPLAMTDSIVVDEFDSEPDEPVYRPACLCAGCREEWSKFNENQRAD